MGTNMKESLLMEKNREKLSFLGQMDRYMKEALLIIQ